MLNPSRFHDLVSGRNRGLGAMFARGLLRVAEVPYTLAVRIRNSRYDRGRAEVQRVDVPVISVGNLTLGGTGKTPMVAYLARWLRSQGVRVTIVSRGYGAEQGARNDEALELEQLLPDVPHLQNPDRVAASRVAVEELGCQVILLDDGFQHRRLHRDLDIVLLDALESDGHGHVFPRGTLREPFSGLSRADVVVLSRCDLVDQATRAALHDRVMKVVPNAVWMEVSHRPIQLRNSSGDIMPLAELQGARVAGFCGIGNPPAFRRTLENIGCQIVSFREFADHHRYDREDVQSLIEWTRSQSVTHVVCTYKDLVKINIDQLGSVPLWAVEIGMEPEVGAEQLAAKLRPLLPGSEHV